MLRAAQSRFRQYVTEHAEAFPDAAFLANRLGITRAKFALALAPLFLS